MIQHLNTYSGSSEEKKKDAEIRQKSKSSSDDQKNNGNGENIVRYWRCYVVHRLLLNHPGTR